MISLMVFCRLSNIKLLCSLWEGNIFLFKECWQLVDCILHALALWMKSPHTLWKSSFMEFLLFSWNPRLIWKIFDSPLASNWWLWAPSLCVSLWLAHCLSLSLRVPNSWRFESLSFEPIYLSLVLRTQQNNIEKESSNWGWNLFRNGR